MCLTKSGQEGYACFTVCKSNFLILHGGHNDCRHHVVCTKQLKSLDILYVISSQHSFILCHDDDRVMRSKCLFPNL